MTYCSECGKPLATPSAKYCSACGSAVPSTAAAISAPETAVSPDVPGALPPVSPRVQPRDPSGALPTSSPPATPRRRGRHVLLGLLVIIGLIGAFMLGARSNDEGGAATNPLSGDTTVAEPGAASTPAAAAGAAGASPGPASDPAPVGSAAGGTTSPVMPLVVGMVLQDAQDLLQAQGSYLLDQGDATGGGRIQFFDSNWKVCSQKPAAGARLASTDVVTLNSVKLDESCP